ncbi:hypothetical protein ElyMa_000260100 [Elysia marginata]|uniref:Raptor N-terminal CASPase-like domain-containing protein n=1 Tax=Elysia marginata TaxID=1093978 RepID=A0AAV4F3R2_9GAST|nr:hypothetical protein ElyMa_000260100 [Elysia marginata]
MAAQEDRAEGVEWLQMERDRHAPGLLSDNLYMVEWLKRVLGIPEHPGLLFLQACEANSLPQPLNPRDDEKGGKLVAPGQACAPDWKHYALVTGRLPQTLCVHC